MIESQAVDPEWGDAPVVNPVPTPHASEVAPEMGDEAHEQGAEIEPAMGDEEGGSELGGYGWQEVGPDGQPRR